ncbi:hypothetical protein [Methylibium petroleiphilum]|nr:hypothetical protein [Methylibium petroleiphilum]
MKKKNLTILAEFFGHMLTGAAMFVGMALLAVGLSRFVDWLPFLHSSSLAAGLLHGVEQCILFADAVFFVWWLIYSTYKALKELMKD